MDEFAFDLDKALDDLEESEAGSTNGSGTPSGEQPPGDVKPQLLPSAPPDSLEGINGLPNHHGNPLTPSHHDVVCNGADDYKPRGKVDLYDPPVTLDLSEADFAPSLNLTPKKIQNSQAEESTGDVISERRDFTTNPDKVFEQEMSGRDVTLNLNVVDSFSDHKDSSPTGQPNSLDQQMETNNVTLATNIPDVIKDSNKHLALPMPGLVMEQSDTDSKDADASLDVTDSCCISPPQDSQPLDYSPFHGDFRNNKQTGDEIKDLSAVDMDTGSSEVVANSQENLSLENTTTSSASCELDQTGESVMEASVSVAPSAVTSGPCTPVSESVPGAPPSGPPSSLDLCGAPLSLDPPRPTSSSGPPTSPDLGAPEVSTPSSNTPDVVGFSVEDDSRHAVDLDRAEMEEYLADMEPLEHKAGNLQESLAASNEIQLHRGSVLPEGIPALSMNGYDEGTDDPRFSVKVSAPVLLTPDLPTPMADHGWARVPGFSAETPISEEVEEEDVVMTSAIKVENAPPTFAPLPDFGVGARPKNVPRAQRPSSGLALIPQVLPIPVRISPCVETSPADFTTPGVAPDSNGTEHIKNCPPNTENSSNGDMSANDQLTDSTQLNEPPQLATPHEIDPSTDQAEPALVDPTDPCVTPDPSLTPDPGLTSLVGASGKNKRPSSLDLRSRPSYRKSFSMEPTPSPEDEDGAEDGAGDGGEDGGGAAGDGEDATAAGGEDGETSNPEIGAVGPVLSEVPPASSNVNIAITDLGKYAPVWVPDSEAATCMQCLARFTFTKRRHHCRACGKVFCSTCCNLRSRLRYMENKEARVCSKCYQDLIRAQVYERMHAPGPRPNPNNPSEYCSTLPPHQQAPGGATAPPPTVMVPVPGVLRKDGSHRRSEVPKKVMFSDGIRPGGDLTELDGSDTRIPSQRGGRRTKRLDRTEDSSKSKVLREHRKNVCLIPETGLPPLVAPPGAAGVSTLEENPDQELVMSRIRSTDDPEPVTFAVNKNLFVLVKIVNLDCCLGRICWTFTTRGMCTVGQDEIVIVLETLPDEDTVPRDIFCHLSAVYEQASKGNTVTHLGHTIFAQGFLGSRDHSGFLYVRPTFQCLQKLTMPAQPYVVGLLLQKWETPWAKVFPIRLMLRLGAEYRYYPCPLVSVRYRKPVYGEIGHTIMNLLADFRNYQYMLAQVPGVTVHMEDKNTTINFPRNRYNNIMKVLTNSNDHVVALGANFSLTADSHLVCLQSEDGAYTTQAINIQNKPRKITGASFVVFNGAYKQQPGSLGAKSSIVEDGLMVQITAETMAALKAALKAMTDFSVQCGAADGTGTAENVTVRWSDDDTHVNVGVLSPIDGRPMSGVPSIRIHTSTDFVGDRHTVRWTEVFFLQTSGDSNARGEPVDLSRLAESLAQATCGALTPLLEKLHDAQLTKIGLRATIDPDKVCYEVGSCGSRLPDTFMDTLDSCLIPVIHNAASQNHDGPVVLELIFHIIE